MGTKTVKIPEKIARKVTEKLELKNQRLQAFVQVSFAVAQGQKKQQESLDLLKNVGDSINGLIKQAFKKLKLGKEKGYTWRYDGKGSFVGVYNPPRPRK